MRKIPVLFLFCFLSSQSSLLSPVFSQAFSPAEIEYLVGNKGQKSNAPQVVGAEEHAQIFYHYFKKDRDPSLVPPPWVDQILDAMTQRAVWQDPEEGVLNEAQLWQAPVSVLYEFFELTRKTFPSKNGGQNASPVTLIRDYEDNRVRFQMSLDRLYRARLGNSLGGRGRTVLSNFDLIHKEMDSIMDALTSADGEQYKTAVMAVGALSHEAYEVLQAPPRGYAPAESEVRGSLALPMMLKLAGLAVIFGAGLLVGTMNEKKIAQMTEDYQVKAKEWAHEYERQFMTVKVNYLVGGPAAGGMLLGILSFDPFGFMIFSGFGIYAGLCLPGWLLKQIKARRAIKCEAQLMDALILMSNGLKSGLDIVACFELVQKEAQPPISEEFGLCIKNYQLGTALERAMEGITDRVPSRLLAYMIKAVIIQRSVGGNLTKIFDRIVENIREESKLVEKTAAMTAQQRIQAMVVGGMPWLMLAAMFLAQTKLMKDFYFTGLGIFVLFGGTLMIGTGMKIIEKMGDVQV